MLSVFVLGFLMGFRHALEADHVLAVATLAKRNSLNEAITQGVAWGTGHTLTLLAMGAAVLFFEFEFTVDTENFLELAVGVMLVILGIDLWLRLSRNTVHIHSHSHGAGQKHIHFHVHENDNAEHADAHDHHHHHISRVHFRALMIGLMHGLAGSSILVVLVLKTVASPTDGIIYILLFGAGSIMGMALLSTAISIPIRYSLTKATWLYRGMRRAIALATLLFGMYILLVTEKPLFLAQLL